MTKKNRFLYLDLARSIAIVLVILNHAVNRTYENYFNQILEFQTIPFASSIFKATMTILSHYGVPFFLMITGVLLIPKTLETKEDVVRFYKHNYLRIFITTESWLFIIFWFRILGSHREMLAPVRLPELFRMLVKTLLFVNQFTYDSMWYMPMILALYLLIPVYSLAIRKMSLFVVLIPMILVILQKMLIPDINSAMSLMGVNKYYSFAISSGDLFSEYYLYLFAGYWIANGGLSKINKYILYLLGIVVFVLSSAYQLWIYSREMDLVLGYTFIGVFLEGCILFEVIRRNADKWQRFAPVFEYVSVRAFAIYFIHLMVMTILRRAFFIPMLSRPLTVAYLEIGSFIGSLIVIEVLSRNRLLKKYMLYM